MEDMFSDEAIEERTTVKDKRKLDDIAALIEKGTDNSMFHAESTGPLSVLLTVRAGRACALISVHHTSQDAFREQAYAPDSLSCHTLCRCVLLALFILCTALQHLHNRYAQLMT